MGQEQGSVTAGPKPLPGEQHLFEPPPEIERVYDPMPIKGTVEVRIDWEADLVALVRKYPAEFAAVDMRGGYAEYERASVFIHELVAEMCECFLGGPMELQERWTEGPEVEFRWTQEMAAELTAKLEGRVPVLPLKGPPE